MPKKTKAAVPSKKRCPRCKRVLDTKKSFYPDKQNKTGYRTYCKACLKKPGKAKGKPGNKAKAKTKGGRPKGSHPPSISHLMGTRSAGAM